MSVTTNSIFNSVASSDVESVSATFTSGIGFYLIAPATSFEVEIDIFLQVQLTPTVTRMVRLEPLNLSTTERLTVIPPQLRDLGLPMYLAIFPSESILLEILLLQPVCSEEIICDRLSQIDSQIDAIAAGIGELQNDNQNLDTLITLILTALGVPAPVSPGAINSTMTFNQLNFLGVI